MNRPPHRSIFFGVVFCVLLVLAGVLLAWPKVSDPDTETRAVERGPADPPWGIKELRPDRSGGDAWYADWDDRGADGWVRWIGASKHEVNTNTAVMKVGGATVRMYVLDPRRRDQWTGALEVTVYARRLPNAGGDPYSGIVTSVRTNHGSAGDLDSHPCDSRGLYARLRFDGQADFGKEVSHPRTVSRNARTIWPNGMPTGEWIGYKHIVYDTEKGVVQELWVDMPNNGQHWRRINRVVDRGTTWGRGETPCSKGIDPALPLRGGTGRPGTETGLPNVAVLFRVDDISPDGGLEYRYASVREVQGR